MSKSIQVTLTSGAAQSQGILELHELSSYQRWWRVARTAFITVLVAAISFLIPVVHFVLTPVVLLAGFIAVGYSTKGRVRIEGIEAQCPACGAAFKILPRFLKLPLQDVCEKCHRQVLIDGAVES